MEEKARPWDQDRSDHAVWEQSLSSNFWDSGYMLALYNQNLNYKSPLCIGTRQIGGMGVEQGNVEAKQNSSRSRQTLDLKFYDLQGFQWSQLSTNAPGSPTLRLLPIAQIVSLWLATLNSFLWWAFHIWGSSNIDYSLYLPASFPFYSPAPWWELDPPCLAYMAFLNYIASLQAATASGPYILFNCKTITIGIVTRSSIGSRQSLASFPKCSILGILPLSTWENSSQSALLEPGALKTLCLGTLHLNGAKHFHCYILEFSVGSIFPSRTFSSSLGIECKILFDKATKSTLWF